MPFTAAYVVPDVGVSFYMKHNRLVADQGVLVLGAPDSNSIFRKWVLGLSEEADGTIRQTTKTGARGL
jgi:hypothetical protein